MRHLKELFIIAIAILFFSLNSFADVKSTAVATGLGAYTNVTIPGHGSVVAGSILGTIGGSSAKFYCIDLNHTFGWGDNFNDYGFTQPKITYVLNKYYPYKPLPYSGSLAEAWEISAIQLAIWHFSDGIDINLCSAADPSIITRALAIVADADANVNSISPVKTLVVYILPGQDFAKGNPIQFRIEVYNELNTPVSGVIVDLSATTGGTLSASVCTTGVGGMSPVMTLTPNSTTTLITINATATVTIPQGTEFRHVSDPNGKQKLVIATPVIAVKSAYATINWWENTDLVVTKTADKISVVNDDIVTYTIKVKNTGTHNATNVQVLDILPIELVYQSSAPAGEYDHDTGIWNVGALNAGVEKTLTIVAKASISISPVQTVDLGLAKPFNVFVLHDMNSSGSDTRGKLAVANDATLNSYAVGDGLPPNSGDVLVVGRKLDFKSGRVSNGRTVYGEFIDTAHCNLSEQGNYKGKPIDFAYANSYLNTLSNTIKTFAATGTTTEYYDQFFLAGNNPGVNIFTVDGTLLYHLTNFEITVPAGATAIVNISGTNITWHNGFKINGTTKEKVLLNFADATTINLAYIGLQGVLLAPKATLNFTSGLVDGQVIVNNIYGQGQFNFTSFDGIINSPSKLITNVAQIMSGAQFSLHNGPVAASILPYTPTSVKNEKQIPKDFVLAQNYPNPFNPSTTIEFGIPKQANVKIIIYNALGNKVTELVNREYQAGTYSVEFNASNYPSGIYYYELVSDNFKSIKKMMILK